MLTKHEITEAETSLNRKNENAVVLGLDRIKRRAIERWENEGGFTVEVGIVAAKRERFALGRWENEGGACLDCL